MNFKMKNYLLILAVFLVTLSSCGKDEADDSTDDDTTTTTTLKTYYIQGKVDGVMKTADYVCEYFGCDMVAGNYDEFMNSINMERSKSASDPSGWNINIYDVNLDELQIPDTLMASGSIHGSGELELSYYTGIRESDNNYTVDDVILGDESFQLIITSKTGDVLEGTFKGELRNGSYPEDRKNVIDGKFKIKLVRI